MSIICSLIGATFSLELLKIHWENLSNYQPATPATCEFRIAAELREQFSSWATCMQFLNIHQKLLRSCSEVA